MGKNFKDITGQKFGRLTALNRIHAIKGHTYWSCSCDCGEFVNVRIDALLGGVTNSCGCYQKKLAKEINTTHGKTKSKLYKVFDAIKQRCYNKHNKQYKHYGGRGIAVCDEWKNDFMTFYDWAVSNGYKEGLTIDRIDVNGNYEPSNCRLATQKQQQRNKRNNIIIVVNGKKHCLMEWCELLNLSYTAVRKRIGRGWAIEKALELEVKQ